MAKLIQYIPGKSLLYRMDPRNKLALAGTFLVMAFLFSRIEYLAAVFILVVILWIAVKAPTSLMRSMLMIMLVFSIFIIIIQGLFFNGPTRTPLLDLLPAAARQGWVANTFGAAGDPARSLVLSKEGVLFGAALTLRLGIVLSIMPIITMITPIKDLSLAVERLGAPWQISYLVLTTFRFLPLLVNQTNTILNAQKLRGLDVEKANLVKRITAYAPLAIPVILGAFRDSQQLEFVLECRGFSSAGKRTSLYDINWKKEDTLILIGLILVLAAAVLLRFNVFQLFLAR